MKKETVIEAFKLCMKSLGMGDNWAVRPSEDDDTGNALDVGCVDKDGKMCAEFNIIPVEVEVPSLALNTFENPFGSKVKSTHYSVMGYVYDGGSREEPPSTDEVEMGVKPTVACALRHIINTMVEQRISDIFNGKAEEEELAEEGAIEAAMKQYKTDK